jgi:hypothetical protein
MDLSKVMPPMIVLNRFTAQVTTAYTIKFSFNYKLLSWRSALHHGRIGQALPECLYRIGATIEARPVETSGMRTADSQRR